MKITKEYLAGLSHEQKDEIILRQAEEIETLKTQVAYLMTIIEELKKEIAELKSGKMKKTSKNSSVPPSQDQKRNKPDSKNDLKKNGKNVKDQGSLENCMLIPTR